jgi:hypothetical protein
MPRGGYRKNAGRPAGVKDSPAARESRLAKIKQYQIIKRLQDLIEGKADMPSHAVTAALGLLRKTMPDLAAVQHTGQVELKRAAELTDDELATIAAGGGTGDSKTQDDTKIVH